MKPSEPKLNVVVFSGGRGTASITDALLRHAQIELTVVVNAYDDGLSTGRLRALLPGMLGPSDVRKCFARLMPTDDRSDVALRTLLEHRLPTPMAFDDGMRALRSLCDGTTPSALVSMLGELRVSQMRQMGGALEAVAARLEQGRTFDFSDCCIGNLIFAGMYLLRGESFNAAIDDFGEWLRARGRLCNVTDGQNLVLVALKEDGTFLRDEAAIVAPQNSSPIRDIFLLERYPSEGEASALALLGVEPVREVLTRREIFPEIAPSCREAIASADIVVYGPGTQHSSLFPSYLTRGLAEAIAANTAAEKVLVTNIAMDHEIQSETTESLAKKVLYFMSRKGASIQKPEALITTAFVQTTRNEAGGRSYLEVADTAGRLVGAPMVSGDWEARQGEHRGGRVVAEIVSLASQRAQKKLKPHHFKVSIVVPCLDEVRTVRGVLEDLMLLDLSPYDLGKEVLFVDGGSHDGSPDAAASVRGVTCLASRLGRGRGRGRALRTGIDAATGNLIVFFPSDGEYQANEIVRLVEPIVRGETHVVFGNRTAAVSSFSDYMRSIYDGHVGGSLMGKYGGMTLSVMGLVLLDRYVGDVLTGVKAFDAKVLRDLNLRADGVDLETELLAKLARARETIVEIPVSYRGRTRAQGKKTRLRDGVGALAMLVRSAATD